MKRAGMLLAKLVLKKSRHVGMEDEVVLGATGIITIDVQVLLPVD